MNAKRQVILLQDRGYEILFAPCHVQPSASAGLEQEKEVAVGSQLSYRHPMSHKVIGRAASWRLIQSAA